MKGVLHLDAIKKSSVHGQPRIEIIDRPVAVLDVMPASAMQSTRLGDIYSTVFEPNGWCLDLALPALVTTASVLVPQIILPDSPTLIYGDDAMTTLFTALIAPLHGGKSQVAEWAAKCLGIFAEGKYGEHYFEVKAGSAEQLISSLSTHKKLKGSALITPDEWAHLFAKASIPDASFPMFMTTSFYRRKQTFPRPNGKEITLDLAMSFIGGIVEDDFDTVFNASTLGGVYDRFLFGRAPDNFKWDYRPCPLPVNLCGSLGWTPVPVRRDGKFSRDARGHF